MIKILVSACLMGEPVRYDGRDNLVPNDHLSRWRAEGRLVVLCPESAGGLPTPRPPAEIEGGGGSDVLRGHAKVVTVEGEDVTPQFVIGAQIAVNKVLEYGVGMAVLKARSPSCGSLAVYDGSHSRTLKPGSGVTAAALERVGIAVFDEEHLDEAAAHLAQLEAARRPPGETP